jgi:hypothetical protein
VLESAEKRINMQMFVCCNDDCRYFRPFEQFSIIRRDEIRFDRRGDLASAIRVLFGDSDPPDGGMASRHFGSQQPYATGANDS